MDIFTKQLARVSEEMNAEAHKWDEAKTVVPLFVAALRTIIVLGLDPMQIAANELKRLAEEGAVTPAAPSAAAVPTEEPQRKIAAGSFREALTQIREAGRAAGVPMNNDAQRYDLVDVRPR